jgi:hypothetical protein
VKIQITDILGGSRGLQTMARELGVNPGGVDSLGGLLGQLGGGSLLGNG